MSCFLKDIYIELKHERVGYTNVSCQRLFDYLLVEYGEKTEELQNKALEDLEADFDMTGPSIKPLRLRQEKLKDFLYSTEQQINDGTYIKKTLGVIEKQNYINKDVLKWRARTLADRTITHFWPYFTAAHKKQKLKLQQGNTEQASSVMMQSKLDDMALQIMRLEKYTDDQQSAINNVIDKVQDDQSRGDRSIPGLIETSTTPSVADSAELSQAQALIASLTSRLTVAEQQRHDPHRQRRQPGRGRGGDRANGGGRGGDGRPRGVLGTVNNDMDRQLTQKEDEQKKKQFKNKNYCHTHGYECTIDHDSAHCMWPEKGHKPCATAENPMGGFFLYKKL